MYIKIEEIYDNLQWILKGWLNSSIQLIIMGAYEEKLVF